MNSVRNYLEFIERKFVILDDSLFPDDSLTLVSLGNLPVLVQKQTKPGENEADSSSGSDDDDNKSVIRSYNEVQYETIFAPPVKFHSYDRKIFIPGVQVRRVLIRNNLFKLCHIYLRWKIGNEKLFN